MLPELSSLVLPGIGCLVPQGLGVGQPGGGDTLGFYPAIEYARASLARKIILRREALGWSQAELARRAGLRVETLCRIETGKVTPSVTSMDKLDRALRKGEGRPARG